MKRDSLVRKAAEEGRFFTLTELATRDAAMIKAAEARGAAAMSHQAIMLSSRFINSATPAKDDFSSGALSAYQNVRDGLKLIFATPDAAAHDAATRNAIIEAVRDWLRETAESMHPVQGNVIIRAADAIRALKTPTP